MSWDKCNYRWAAPMLLQPKRIFDKPETAYSYQVCVLEKGHSGDHRSSTKVTTPNKKEN